MAEEIDRARLKLRAQAELELSNAQQDAPDIVEGMGRAAVQGGFGGFGDEAIAGGVALKNELLQLAPETFQSIGDYLGLPGSFSSVDRPMGDVYDASLANERQRLAQFRGTNPWLAYPAEIIGSLPAAIATGGTGLGGALGVRMLQGAGIAAAQGGVYGFGAGEGGFGNRVGSAAMSAGLAAPLGLAAPAIGRGVQNIANWAGARRAASGVGTTVPAMNIALRAAAADGALTGRGAQNIADAGPEAMLADAGPTMQGLLDTAIQRSGPGGVVARDAVEARATQASQDMMAALDNTLGPPQGILETARNISTSTSAARGAAYDTAYEQAIDYASDTGRRIEETLLRIPRSTLEKAIQEANDEMISNGVVNQQIMASIADDGTVTFREMPNVEQLDEIKKALQRLGRENVDQFGRATGQGLRARRLASELRAAIDDAVPEYGAATRAGGDKIALDEALDLGANLSQANTTREIVRAATAGMSQVERDMVATGFRSQIDEALANVKRSVGDDNMDAREAIAALKALSSRAVHEKLAMVIGEDAATQLFSEIDRASMAFSLRAAVTANSRTFGRTATDEAVKAQTEEGVMNAIRSGRPLDAWRRAAEVLGGRTAADKLRLSDETYSALVEMLTGPRGQGALTQLLRLQGAQQAVNPSTPLAGLLARNAVGAPAAPLAASATSGLIGSSGGVSVEFPNWK
jgi:hypothetical protein